LEIAGHKTSVSLEDEFWSALKEIARNEGVTAFDLATRIDNARTAGSKSNLSSAIRLFVLDHYIRRRSPVGVAAPPG
jgi:predicted DNA-binding ribbon-helix-helix protein